ncbi:hypothetical protein CAEBREN_23450 [Caenorhabditis brenneri]|uniref:F-box domain-containing protein n=1 Tax=Caenorhabditis brenneri TaxID=135651 RepID=G0N3G5_CAEBE|nr:hypothetical protein CAEBREN_23450 [Caenorhabditis brenneri]
MASTFPLLRLPSRAIKFVLKYHDIAELILFSTLSNHAKNLVKSDKRNALNIEFLVCNGCYVNLYCSNTIMFGESPQQECGIESSSPCTVRVIDRWDPVEISFPVPGFNGVRDWIEHFMFIFNYSMVDVSFGPRDEWKYSHESIKKVLKCLPIGHLSVFENACEIVKNFPIMDSLYVDKTDSEPELQGEDLKFIKGVLIGNIARLEVNRVISMDLGTLFSFTFNCIPQKFCLASEKDNSYS